MQPASPLTGYYPGLTSAACPGLRAACWALGLLQRLTDIIYAQFRHPFAVCTAAL